MRKADQEENFFIGGYAREGGLIYTPGDIDPPNFQFAGDSTYYNLFEDRNFTTLGIRSTFDARLSRQFMVKVGFNISSTNGAENFTSSDSLQNPRTIDPHELHWFRFWSIRRDRMASSRLDLVRSGCPL